MESAQEKEWWQIETNLKPEDILDIIKTDPRIDEWRKYLIEELLEDRLVTALREESERLAALHVSGVVEKGVRWDGSLQRDILQRVRREIRKSLIFQRFREELKARLNTSQVKEELKQLCASCLELRENSAVMKNVDRSMVENTSVSSSKAETVVSRVVSGEVVEGSLESSREVCFKAEFSMEVEENKNNIIKMESEDTMNEQQPPEYFVQNSKEDLNAGAEHSYLKESHALETPPIEKHNESEMPNKEQKEEVALHVSKHSRNSRKPLKLKEDKLTFVDQGTVAQCLGPKMIGRRVKLLRFTDKGQMKWVSFQVLEYDKDSQQHKIQTEQGDEEWILFSKENVLLSK